MYEQLMRVHSLPVLDEVPVHFGRHLRIDSLLISPLIVNTGTKRQKSKKGKCLKMFF